MYYVLSIDYKDEQSLYPESFYQFTTEFEQLQTNSPLDLELTTLTDKKTIPLSHFKHLTITPNNYDHQLFYLEKRKDLDDEMRIWQYHADKPLHLNEVNVGKAGDELVIELTADYQERIALSLFKQPFVTAAMRGDYQGELRTEATHESGRRESTNDEERLYNGGVYIQIPLDVTVDLWGEYQWIDH